MPMRYQAGFITDSNGGLRVPNTPVIGTASPGICCSTSARVRFTPPSAPVCNPILSYTAISTPGCFTGTGSISPVTVTGLTAGSSYTFRVYATNKYGRSGLSSASNSVTTTKQGQQIYLAAGTYTWVAPASVTSVSVVAIGAGGSGTGSSFGGCPTCGYFYSSGCGGGGGALTYGNNITVTPGASYTVRVGAGGSGTSSYFNSTSVLCAGAGGSSAGTSSGSAKTGGGNGGGRGAGRKSVYCGFGSAGGGGGAGGYTASGTYSGGVGGSWNSAGSAGYAGSGAGGGGYADISGRGGGGSNIFGAGTTGAYGTPNAAYGGSGGSGGGNGGNASGFYYVCRIGAVGGGYGGGGGGGVVGYACFTNQSGGTGGPGALRIVWPGSSRSFPSTNVSNCYA